MKQLIGLSLLFLLACNSSPSNSTDQAKIDAATKKAPDDDSAKFDRMVDSIKKANGVKPGKPVTPVIPSKWEYTDQEDRMGSSPMHFAIIDANEPVVLEYPYGTVTASIQVRHRRGRNEVMLLVTKGQFSNTSDGINIRVKFDEGKIETYNCN